MAEPWAILDATDIGDGYFVVTSQGPNGVAVRIVKPREGSESNDPERFHVYKAHVLNVPSGHPATLFNETVAATIEHARTLGNQPKAKTTKGVTAKQADPAVIAALASNPEALSIYLKSL